MCLTTCIRAWSPSSCDNLLFRPVSYNHQSLIFCACTVRLDIGSQALSFDWKSWHLGSDLHLRLEHDHLHCLKYTTVCWDIHVIRLKYMSYRCLGSRISRPWAYIYQSAYAWLPLLPPDICSRGRTSHCLYCSIIFCMAVSLYVSWDIPVFSLGVFSTQSFMLYLLRCIGWYCCLKWIFFQTCYLGPHLCRESIGLQYSHCNFICSACDSSYIHVETSWLWTSISASLSSVLRRRCTVWSYWPEAIITYTRHLGIHLCIESVYMLLRLREKVYLYMSQHTYINILVLKLVLLCQ